MCFARALIFCCFITFGVEIYLVETEMAKDSGLLEISVNFRIVRLILQFHLTISLILKKPNNVELFPDPDERSRRMTVTVLTLVNHVLFSYLQQLIFSMLRRRVTAFACQEIYIHDYATCLSFGLNSFKVL